MTSLAEELARRPVQDVRVVSEVEPVVRPVVDVPPVGLAELIASELNTADVGARFSIGIVDQVVQITSPSFTCQISWQETGGWRAHGHHISGVYANAAEVVQALGPAIARSMGPRIRLTA